MCEKLLTLPLDQGKHFLYPPADFILRDFPDGGAVSDIVIDTHMREKRIVLENRVHIPLIWLFLPHALALHLDDAAGRILKAGDHAQGGCFSAARGTQQGQELSLPNF